LAIVCYCVSESCAQLQQRRTQYNGVLLSVFVTECMVTFDIGEEERRPFMKSKRHHGLIQIVTNNDLVGNVHR
jgi:hypothetical protein